MIGTEGSLPSHNYLNYVKHFAMKREPQRQDRLFVSFSARGEMG
jgi:hypothetical protein